MPRRDDIKKILLIGSGPIVIGQAAEFDYSGVQACKVLIAEGYEVAVFADDGGRLKRRALCSRPPSP